MYQCKVCGNKKHFIEENSMETVLILDEETGEVRWTHDDFVACSEVICGVCKASSEDRAILDRNTMEPAVL